jgi:hypothetical protein
MTDAQLQQEIRAASEELHRAQREEMEAIELARVGAQPSLRNEPSSRYEASGRGRLAEELKKRGIQTKGKHW